MLLKHEVLMPFILLQAHANLNAELHQEGLFDKPF